MTTDELNTPLVPRRSKRSGFAVPRAFYYVTGGILTAALGTFAVWTATVEDPLGGEPIAIVPADLRAPPAARTSSVEAPTLAEGGEDVAVRPADGQTVTIIDGTSGKRQEVVVGKAPQPDPPGSAGGDDRILEITRYGAIPKVGADGERAFEVYARPVKASAESAGKPRIAILVGGLGVSATTTAEAVAKLPGAVTLGFAPYGTDLARMVQGARGDGHEIVLQVPMEPREYPENDPGPRTLLASLTAEQNIDRLHWFMSRFQGYVGIANYMGARFTAQEPALSPILRETARRGLIFIDDGGSSRSLASQIAGLNNVPFAKGALTLDAVPTAPEIDTALAKLEDIARERGSALGIAGAVPAAIDRIAAWARTAEERGFLLVPVSAIAVYPKGS